MNKDFHYYGTYFAARQAGYDNDDAVIIAHAAQMVDDVCSDKLVKEPCADFEQRQTVQSLRELEKYMKNFRPFVAEELTEIRKIWVPFHFLPGNLDYQRTPDTLPGVYGKIEHYRTDFRLLCLTNSALAEEIVNNVNKNQNEPYTLYLTGVVAHVLADTWAHCYFAGIPAAYINNTIADDTNFKEIFDDRTEKIHFASWSRSDYKSVLDMKSWTGPLNNHYLRTGEGLHENSTCYLGHGRAGSIPDYGSMKYTYKPMWLQNAGPEEDTLIKDNRAAFFNAIGQLTLALKCIKEKRCFSTGEYFNFKDDVKTAVKRVIGTRLKDQSENWKQLIQETYNVKIPSYNVNEWYPAHNSDWTTSKYYQFAKAADIHYRCVEQYLKLNGNGVSLEEEWSATNDFNCVFPGQNYFATSTSGLTIGSAVTINRNFDLSGIIRFNDGGYISKIRLGTTSTRDKYCIEVEGCGPKGVTSGSGYLRFIDEAGGICTLSLYEHDYLTHKVNYSSKKPTIVRIEWNNNRGFQPVMPGLQNGDFKCARAGENSFARSPNGASSGKKLKIDGFVSLSDIIKFNNSGRVFIIEFNKDGASKDKYIIRVCAEGVKGNKGYIRFTDDTGTL